MNFNELKELTGELSKDVKLNLNNVLAVEGAPGLSSNQIFAIALACAYATRNSEVVEALQQNDGVSLREEEKKAAQTAAILMAMNNVYYRTMHYLEDSEIKRLPARLRMTGIANSGVDKLDFELYCLAVSALNGCSACVNSHSEVLKRAGLSNEGIQSAVRIASVISSAAQTLSIRRME